MSISKNICSGHLHVIDEFHNVIWTDETTVQMESHRRLCCQKRGQKPRYKPRPKYPTKVHVWAGISWNGSTRVCVFDGIMTAEVYVNILSQCLVSFCQQVYANGHWFMQDNDPKHTSPHAQSFFLRRTGSTGGGRPPKVLMPIQLRTFGTNLR